MRKREFLILTSSLVMGASSFAQSDAIETREMEYRIDGVPFKGFVALPKGKGKVPGVLVIHEWWGHNEYARKRARQLAELGYAAFALDMYGSGKVADEPIGAQHLMTEAVNSGKIQARFDGAMQILKSEVRVDPGSIGAIGYCFGGNVVLTMARAGEPLKAVASFHGSLPAKADLKKDSVQPEILMLHGGDDVFVSPEAIAQFKKEMTAANANYRFIVYPGAKHGFTDQDNSERGEKHHIPIAYNKEADEKSWSEMKALFKRTFQ
ncbi:dienelactone hydrolase family protein [Polaromonas sp.]|uniref:dienelactone hydrolase family protein n=1 Tax=Polaromonas sp. TaxID=1869339 RepID=UPI0032679334